MTNRKQVQFEPLRSVAFGSITGSYTALGSPLVYSARMMRLVNATDKDMFISDDGTNNKLYVPSNSFILYDFSTNRYEPDSSFYVAAGTQIYIKYAAAPGSGAFYLEAIYGVQTPI